MVFVGIDPGLDGWLVVIDGDGRVLEDQRLPTLKLGTRRDIDVAGFNLMVEELVATYERQNMRVVLEKHTPRPGQGVASQCKLARICGVLEAVLFCAQLKFTVVHPATWSKVLRDVEGDNAKARSVLAARRLFPTLEITKKLHHNKADAALIAEFGRLQHYGKTV